jgi:DnaK suppressor protein
VKLRAEFIEKIKHLLIERKGEMVAQFLDLSQEKASDGQVQDSGDEALSLTMENLQNSLQKTEIDEIKLIEGALNRIERGAYGACVDCGDQISERRLENFPYAARCIVCQEALEK